jgi:hypothetical protein
MLTRQTQNRISATVGSRARQVGMNIAAAVAIAALSVPQYRRRLTPVVSARARRSVWACSAGSSPAQRSLRPPRRSMAPRQPRSTTIRRNHTRAITTPRHRIIIRPSSRIITAGRPFAKGDRALQHGLTAPGPSEGRALPPHHLFLSSRNLRNTVLGSGFSGKSGKASRSRRITVGLVSRKKVLISLSNPSVVTSAFAGS